MQNITVVGVGYVGLSTAVNFASHTNVIALDINEETVEKINRKESPLKEEAIRREIRKDLKLKATTDKREGYEKANMIFMCLPTNFNNETNSLETKIIESEIKIARSYNKDATIVIKSTVPIGFTKSMIEKYDDGIVFSPEFMREGSALKDVSNPTRIIIGAANTKRGSQAAGDVAEISYLTIKNEPPIYFTGTSEAEAIKLFSNAYLAMRVAFFNELDSFAELNELNTKQIIDGVCADPRINNSYSNPSFGYGGYCLPKDTKQLCTQTNGILIDAITKSNTARIKHVAKQIAKKTDGVIGIQGVAMKAGSDNARESSSLKLAGELIDMGKRVSIYNGSNNDRENLEKFVEECDFIVSNRKTPECDYTRDVYGTH